MKNNKKDDDISINIISAPNNVKPISKAPVGNAAKDAFCIYAGMRHAVGSVIEMEDGSKVVCTDDGSWQNT
ncbi:hypothetical protein KQI42_04440 [Tissierella sp. MSJ-40]|uniref:Uncharacterized protein n=1 Tax=Tissierella simiarum TaxID=2841534 RepID=A0ABS6E4S3_9FIRM|nr:hypothetical protein [Tissierella simiarum]MBU5437244.1 hypothetical protein [Tissierella simiarum]